MCKYFVKICFLISRFPGENNFIIINCKILKHIIVETASKLYISFTLD